MVGGLNSNCGSVLFEGNRLGKGLGFFLPNILGFQPGFVTTGKGNVVAEDFGLGGSFGALGSIEGSPPSGTLICGGRMPCPQDLHFANLFKEELLQKEQGHFPRFARLYAL